MPGLSPTTSTVRSAATQASTAAHIPEPSSSRIGQPSANSQCTDGSSSADALRRDSASTPLPRSSRSARTWLGKLYQPNMVRTSSAHGPISAIRPTAGRGRIPSFDSRTALDWATAWASRRLSGLSRSNSPARRAGGRGSQSGSRSPSSTFCRSTRRTARSTRSASTDPCSTAWTSASPKPRCSGSSTSIPARRASAPASGRSAATRRAFTGNGRDQ